MKALFVTGTDTGVGKTVITGCLAKYFSKDGLSVITQKWVQTGAKNGFSQDIDAHLKIMGKNRGHVLKYYKYMLPYVFSFPASAHLAARLEQKTISQDKIKRSFKALISNFEYVVVEGAGGVLMPISVKSLLIDVAKDLKLPVLLVAENRLGAINQVLMSLEVLKARGMNVLGVVFNNLKKCDSRILEDNPRIIKSLARVRVFGVLRKTKSFHEAYRDFEPIAKKICRCMQ